MVKTFHLFVGENKDIALGALAQGRGKRQPPFAVKVVRASLTGMAGMHSIGNSQPPRRAEREPLQLYLIVSTKKPTEEGWDTASRLWNPEGEDDSILATNNCFNPAEFLCAEILLRPQNSIV